MGRWVSLLYGVVCYIAFLASFLYAILFVGDFWGPRTINVGPQADFTLALTINVILLGLFAIQHSLMARDGFKRLWTKIVPKHLERSTYVLFSSLLLILLYWQWRPMTREIWSIQSEIATLAIWGVFGLGWLLVLMSTFMIDHFDLFGLRQVWSYFRNVEFDPPSFQTPALYRYVRHPIMLGFILGFWATPNMTLGHLLFAVMTTGYIVVGVLLEERDLMNYFGEAYRHYRSRVPMFFPWKPKPYAPEESETEPPSRDSGIEV